MIIKTSIEDKLLFNFIIKEHTDSLLNIDPSFFENSDVKNIFGILKKYFSKYNELPQKQIIKQLLKAEDFTIDDSLLKLILLSDEEWNEIQRSHGSDYLKNLFEKHYHIWFRKYKTLKDIDIARDTENIDNIKKRNFDDGYIDPFQIDEDSQEVDALKETNLINESVYQRLPGFLKSSSKLFTGRERDVYLTSELVVLSALFDNVKGLYGIPSVPVYANLFAFIAAPAGNGKGVLSCAKNTLFHIKMKENQENQERRLKSSESENKNLKDKHLQIPGNASVAAFINGLMNNDGIGLTIETEADTITNNKKQDWGDYDVCLREGFHHETISLIRKDERVDIQKPKISFIATGTMNQLKKFVPSTENGLFSRFLYYTFQQDPTFRNPFGINGDYEKIFQDEFGKELLDIYEYYRRYDNNGIIEYEFRFTDNQKEKFNNEFSEKLIETSSFSLGSDISGSIFRLGLITFRIAMILSILRNYEIHNNDIFNNHIGNAIVCSDDDFEVAIELFHVYLSHMKLIYDNMPNTDQINFKRNNADRLFDEMPMKFTNQLLYKTAEKYDRMGIENCKKYIQKWKNAGKIKKEGNMLVKV